MGRLYDMLSKDIRYQEGMTACINCGTCTAVCPAAEFYKYDPRQILDTVQTKDESAIENLLKSDTIWYCGECMSCVTRCPRSNAPGLVIIALRSLSQDLGYFTESEKGRQQLALKRTVGDWILEHGYCVYVRKVSFENHPEAGMIWKWELENLDKLYERLGANLDGKGPGVLRKIPQESLNELKRIFDVTGGIERFNQIENKSLEKATELGLTDGEYFTKIYTTNNGNHMRE
ncbi:MAG: 4Fe-4S dicluster domain-containing protein [Prevotellaceae bacterium]|jgi:heterodisulfide reductase subunit C|nr:4Fe-4S dicluster domain-containing protein [Prevotellaceae bacterium]